MAVVFCEQENGWHIWQDTCDRGRYHVVRPGSYLTEFEYDHLPDAEAKMKELMAEAVAKENE